MTVGHYFGVLVAVAVSVWSATFSIAVAIAHVPIMQSVVVANVAVICVNVLVTLRNVTRI